MALLLYSLRPFSYQLRYITLPNTLALSTLNEFDEVMVKVKWVLVMIVCVSEGVWVLICVIELVLVSVSDCDCVDYFLYIFV